ncbi:MAG: NAAT family transporter [Xanthomonadales bacterium]|jgi:multiple antibiotic resistance protein|nr:NAAT family transporter [Xanthomonadales bacterium]
MDPLISWFVHGLLLVPVTLLPIINPLSTAPVFAATVGSNRDMAKRLARQVAINAWFVMVVSMLIGTYVLALFGISLPVVRIGGGLLVVATAWQMLHHVEDEDMHALAAEEAVALPDAEIVQRSFFPITFPLTTGPGTIAASIALGAKIPHEPVKYVLGVLVAVCGAAIVSLALYLIFRHSIAVLAWLGRIGTLVMIRLMAFILLCIGIEIMWTGWAELNGISY